MNYCKNCKTELPEGIKFCPNCGADIIKTTRPTDSYDLRQVKQFTDSSCLLSKQQQESYYPNPYINPSVNASQYSKSAANLNQPQNINQFAEQNMYNGVSVQPELNQNAADNLFENPYLYQNIPKETITDIKPKGKDRGLRIGIMVAVVSLFAIWFIINTVLVKLQTPAYEKPVRNMYRALENSDYNNYLDSFPDYIKDLYEANEAVNTENSDNMSDALKKAMKNTYGEDVVFTYQINGKKELTEDEIKAMEISINNTYQKNVDIKKGYKLEIETTVKGSLKEDTNTGETIVILIDSKWYISYDSML